MINEYIRYHPGCVERLEIIREKGTNRCRFFRGQVDKYTWVDLGSSFLPSDLLAAHLYAQLESRPKIQNHRQCVWEYYFKNLQEAAKHQLLIFSIDCSGSDCPPGQSPGLRRKHPTTCAPD